MNRTNVPLWGRLDLGEYVPKTFATPHVVDQEIIDTFHSVLQGWGVKPQSADRVGDVVLGYNLYPSMLLAGYTKEEGWIDQISVLPQDVTCASKLCGYGNRVYRSERGEVHPSVWGGYDTLIYQICGQRSSDPFYGSLDRATKLVRPIRGSVFGKPRRPYDIVSSILSLEEYSEDKDMCLFGLRNMVDWFLRTGGIIALAVMVEPPPYKLPSGLCIPYPDFRAREMTEFFRSLPLKTVVRRIKASIRGEREVLFLIGQK